VNPSEIWPAVRAHIRETYAAGSTGELIEIRKAAQMFSIYHDAMPPKIKKQMAAPFNAHHKTCDCGGVAVEVHKGALRCATCRDRENRIALARHQSVALRNWRLMHARLRMPLESPDAFHVVGGLVY